MTALPSPDRRVSVGVWHGEEPPVDCATHSFTRNNTPEHADAAGLGIPDAGIRAVHGYGNSVDTCIAVGGDIVSGMRALLAGTRYLVNLKALEENELIDPLPVKATDVLRMATQGGARAAWLGDVTGSAPGAPDLHRSVVVK